MQLSLASGKLLDMGYQAQWLAWESDSNLVLGSWLNIRVCLILTLALTTSQH